MVDHLDEKFTETSKDTKSRINLLDNSRPKTSKSVSYSLLLAQNPKRHQKTAKTIFTALRSINAR